MSHLLLDFLYSYTVKFIQYRRTNRKKGEAYLLAKIVCKKLKKGKQLNEIADELEEEYSVIENIYRAAERFAPDYDVEKVRELMMCADRFSASE